jgi:hypothetical protein
MPEQLTIAWFCLEGDNVWFRGLDSGREIEGYACPLFDYTTAKMIAPYISTASCKVVWNVISGKFMLVTKKKTRELITYEIGNQEEKWFVFDFSGWPWQKTDFKKKSGAD